MNYWIFKFNSKLWGDENWDKIPEGHVEHWVTGENEKNVDGRLGDIVFGYRIDQTRGIYYILEIVEDRREVTDDGMVGIKLKTIKRVDPYYSEESLLMKHKDWVEKSKNIGNSPRYRFREDYHHLSEKLFKDIMNG